MLTTSIPSTYADSTDLPAVHARGRFRPETGGLSRPGHDRLTPRPTSFGLYPAGVGAILATHHHIKHALAAFGLVLLAWTGAWLTTGKRIRSLT
jgi:hypothetical protein